MKSWKRGCSWMLVLAMLMAPVLQVSAEEAEQFPEQETVTALEETETTEATEVTEETEVTEVTEETEATEATEATEVTEETEATDVTEETEATEVTEATEAAEATETIEEAEVTEEAQPLQEQIEMEKAAVFSSLSPITIDAVLETAAGEDTIVTEGIVVFAGGTQAVLQDATGGIRLAFQTPPEIAAGDILRVTGRRRSSGFAVDEFEITGTGTLPVVESTLTEGRNDLRILVKGVVLGWNSLSQNSYTCQLVGTVPEGIQKGDRVDVWGVLVDGVFYADTFVKSENQETEESLSGEWNFYFGQLHAHTDISDGTGTVEEAFRYASQVENLDFFAVTDHSNAFDNADQGSVTADGEAISREWAAGKAAAESVTDETFVGIFGYEMTWPEDLAIGHISTFGTPGWQTRDQDGMHTLKGYLDALEAVPDSVSQFNHPGILYGDFRSFTEYSPRYDARVHLLEVGGEGSFTAYEYFAMALDAGCHLAPSNNQNNHNGNWGDASQARTVVLARDLTEAAIYDAVRNYRVYATEDADLKIEYRLNDRIMGSVMGDAATLTADILLEDGSGDPIGTVEVITDGGAVAASAQVPEAMGGCSLEISGGGSYYYLRIRRDGKTVAVTAPVWVDTYEDLGVTEFATSVEKPDAGAETILTLTLFNHEDQPFVVDQVVFTAGTQTIETMDQPGSVAPLGTLEIPLHYTQATAGTVTITATVTGTIGGLSRRYQKTVTLRYQAPEAQTVSVADVRDGILGDAYRIRGYVTAGTANPYNMFGESIYLQDDSGGIEIMDFTLEGVQLGAPLEVEGILRSTGGNLVLAMTDYEVLAEDFYRYVPETMAHETAMDYEAHGGELLQIEGHVVSITGTSDKQGVSRFTIRDIVGDMATVIIEDGIGSGAYGTNELASEVKATRSVRAIGLLHIDEYGEPVLRVRNCDEVVYVPPRKDPSNPRTGDWFAWLQFWKR